MAASGQLPFDAQSAVGAAAERHPMLSAIDQKLAELREFERLELARSVELDPAGRQLVLRECGGPGLATARAELRLARQTLSRRRRSLGVVQALLSWIPWAKRVAPWATSTLLKATAGRLVAAKQSLEQQTQEVLRSPEGQASIAKIRERGELQKASRLGRLSRRVETLRQHRTLVARCLRAGIAVEFPTAQDFDPEGDEFLGLIACLEAPRQGGVDTSLQDRRVAPPFLRQDSSDPRIRTMLPFGQSPRVYLPVPRAEMERARAAGGRLDGRGEIFVEVGDPWREHLNPLLPYSARPDAQPLRPDLAPTSSPGSDLKRLLAPPVWAGLEKHVIDRRGRRCQICGETEGGVGAIPVWAFHAPPLSNAVGVQRLIGLACLCLPCRDMFPAGALPGTASGPRPRMARARLARLNAWKEEQSVAYEWEQRAKHQTRSELAWSLDLSVISRHGLLHLADQWGLDARGTLRRQGARPAILAQDASPTMIFGASYAVAGRIFQAEYPEHAYEGLLPADGDLAFIALCGTGVAFE